MVSQDAADEYKYQKADKNLCIDSILGRVTQIIEYHKANSSDDHSQLNVG